MTSLSLLLAESKHINNFMRIVLAAVCLMSSIGCTTEQPTQVLSNSIDTMYALDTIYTCRYLLNSEHANRLITSKESLDSIEQWMREGKYCADFEFPTIDFSRFTLLSVRIVTDGRVDSLKIHVEADSLNKTYLCRTVQYFKGVNDPFSPAVNYNSKLLLFPSFNSDYSLSFEVDTIFKNTQ